jgi:UDPglucose 6-dehydrogenase
MRVALIGMGVVGQAQAELFKQFMAVTYDPAVNKAYPKSRIAGCDFAVVSVGTPANLDGSNNLEYVYQAVEALPYNKPVLIRSTITPGTMADLQQRYPERWMAHAPEFLHEREGGQWSKSIDVPFMVLGSDRGDALSFFRNALSKVFPGRFYECSAETSEMAKYVANLHWAVKVTFVNEMARICEQLGADWEQVREAWVMDPRVAESYTRMKGFPPGFGGRCWPKDLSALIAASEEAGYHPDFLISVLTANEGFTFDG